MFSLHRFNLEREFAPTLAPSDMEVIVGREVAQFEQRTHRRAIPDRRTKVDPNRGSGESALSHRVTSAVDELEWRFVRWLAHTSYPLARVPSATQRR
jgi:hypothetical protein